MPRAIWRGALSFGLINVPVTLHVAESRKDLNFHLVDERDRSRIRYRRVNEETGEEVPSESIVKAYDLDDGRRVLLREEDFERADIEATHTVDIIGFVKLEEIAVTHFDRPYYMLPDSGGGKGYMLLREALRETGKAAVSKVVLRSRQHLAAVLPMQDALVLELLRFPQELRDMDNYEFPHGSLEDFRISEKELEMARNLIEAMSTPWSPQEYRDEYTESLLAYIASKAESGEAVEAAQEARPGPETGKVVDMMDLLRKSLERQKKDPSGSGGKKRKAAARG